MAVTKVGAVIAIWTICAVLVVAIIVVAVILIFRRRQAVGSVCGAKVGDLDAAGPYAGYGRLTGSDVCVDPAPGPHAGRRVVHLSRSADGANAIETSNSPCDILVNVFYVDPTIAAGGGGGGGGGFSAVSAAEAPSRLLGTEDHCYNGPFLLYTAPLEFIAAGVYVIQAHTVYRQARAVGPVHQFIFSISAGDEGCVQQQQQQQQQQLVPYNDGSGRSHNIDINLARSATSGALVPASDAVAHQQQPVPASSSIYPYNNFSNMNSAAVAAAVVLPPSICPAGGTVTTRTPIAIAPHAHSTTADQLRYSVDGSYPSTLYTGPFHLSLPPEAVAPTQRLDVVVRAVAVSQVGGRASAVAEAQLRVQPAGYSFFDPDVPTPRMRLRAVDATLYFDESKNPPGARTAYQLLTVHQVRRRKAKFSRTRCQLYERSPIPIAEDVALVYAWTVDEAEWNTGALDNGLVRSGNDSDSDDDDDGVYVGSNTNNNNNNRNRNKMRGSGRSGTQRLRSVAAVYDCSRGAAEQAKPSRKRAEQLRSTAGLQLLPPPVICVSCAEMEVEFEEVPANTLIAYTLNRTEPALYDVSPPACAVEVASALTSSQSRRKTQQQLQQPGRRRHQRYSDDGDDGDDDMPGDEGGLSTFRYEAGKRIRVTLMETEGVYVTARVFAPIYESGDSGVAQAMGSAAGQGGSSGALAGYRYGKPFRRGFFFTD